MGFWGRIGAGLGFATPPAPRAEGGQDGVPPAIAELLRGGTTSAERALTASAVHRSVSLISGAVGSMPIHVRRRTKSGREEVNDHWIYPLLRRKPNKWQTPQQFKRLLQTHLLMRGNAYALKVGTAKGGYSQLIPLHPDRVTVRQVDDWALAFDYTTKGGARRTLPQADVMHLVGLSLDGVTGVSVLKCAAETIGQSIDLRMHGRAVFRNSTRLGGVLTHPKISAPKRRRIFAPAWMGFVEWRTPAGR